MASLAAAPALPTARRAARPRLSRTGRTAALAIALLIGGAVLGPLVWSVDPLAQSPEARLSDPSWEFPLGSDQFGRDILARLLAGARWSLVGAAAVCTGTSILGFLVGALAATGRRFTDNVLGRLIESLMAIPNLVTALAMTAVLGASFGNLLVAMVSTSWPWYGRTYRSLILKERSALYVEAATAIGARRVRILARHIVPNVLGPALVIATANFGAVILNLASLSFLGLGMQPPTPEWGMMINEARVFFQRKPWQMLAPGLCIAITVLSINLLGDALRDRIDPRTVVRRR